MRMYDEKMKNIQKWIAEIAAVCLCLTACGETFSLRDAAGEPFPNEIVLYSTNDGDMAAAANLETVPETEAAANPETVPETEAAANPETVPETEAAADPETIPETEAAADLETVPETEAADTFGINSIAGEADDSGLQTKKDVIVPEAAEEGEDLVWVPVNGGTKYHKSAACSKMKDPIQVSRETAINNGYEPCKRCYK